MALNVVADFAGVSRSQFYDVLAAKKAASLDWLEKVAQALDVEPWELLRPTEHARSGKPQKRRPAGR